MSKRAERESKRAERKRAERDRVKELREIE